MRRADRARVFWVLTLVPSVIALAGPAFATHVVAFFLNEV